VASLSKEATPGSGQQRILKAGLFRVVTHEHAGTYGFYRIAISHPLRLFFLPFYHIRKGCEASSGTVSHQIPAHFFPTVASKPRQVTFCCVWTCNPAWLKSVCLRARL